MHPRIPITCVLLAFASRAHAQQVLFHTGGWDTRPINGALLDLGIDARGVTDEDEFLDLLESQAWDLVIIRKFQPYGPVVRSFILAELEAHVDRGGALMFSVAQLDEMPEFWPLLGVEGASDLELPLSRIFTTHVPPHPSLTFGGLSLGNEVYGPDYGDALTPTASGFVIAEYLDVGQSAIVMSRDGRVITNGQEWDNWASLGAIATARDQISWLIGCPADLDGDGGTTVFDFLEFQNRFDSGGSSGFADFCYDGRLDVFDFLEFLNLFDQAC